MLSVLNQNFHERYTKILLLLLLRMHVCSLTLYQGYIGLYIAT